MSLWRRLVRGIQALVRPGRAELDLDDEVQHYLAESEREWLQRGLSPEQARRAARLEVGNVTAVREQIREADWEAVLIGWLADLRYAARRLRHDRGFTVVSGLTLALGLGAATAIWSAVGPVLFESLPYPDPDRILAIWDRGPGGSRADVTFGSYRELAQRSRSFEALAVTRPWQPTLTGQAEPERLEGQSVSQEYFRVLGVGTAVGRAFEPADDGFNGPRVIILSHALWRRRFNTDPAIVGRQVRLNDVPHIVLGVMPERFEDVLAPAAEVWSPLQYDPSLPPTGPEWGHHLRLIGRLRAGVAREDAAQELQRIARSPQPDFIRVPWAALEGGLLVYPLRDDVTHTVRPALLAILGAVGLLLAIACVNVTGLLLTRGARRGSEFALRAALGASRGRLARQVLAESLLLAAAAGGLGLLLAHAGVAAVVSLAPAGLPRVDAIRLDAGGFGFALAAVTLLAFAVGLAPSLSASRIHPGSGLHPGGRITPGRHQTLRRGLVVAEVALALVLLIGAGLLFRSLQRLFAIAPGFEPSQVLTLQVHAASRRYEDAGATHQFFAQVLDAVRQVPGVRSAGFTNQLPLSGDFDQYGVTFETEPAGAAEEQGVFRYGVSPGYVETMEVPLLRGRLLDERDTPGAPIAVLISQSYALRRFPGGDPIGQRLHLGRTDQPWYTIVGVVGDVKQASLALSDADAVYVPTRQWYSADQVQSLVVRTTGNPAALAPAIRRAVWSVDPDQPITRVISMDELVAQSEAQRRFAMVLLEVFALAALILAAIGIYGIVSNGVTERTREIGVRSALGATRTGIVGLVVRQGMLLTGIGVAIGLAAALGASRAIVSLLFGVSRLDPPTYAGVVLLLGVTALAACALPAWRAGRIDPASTLRME